VFAKICFSVGAGLLRLGYIPQIGLTVKTGFNLKSGGEFTPFI
jgi:hypothetical protein